MDETLQTDVINGFRKERSKKQNKGRLVKMAKHIRKTFVLMFACYRPNKDDILRVPQQIDGTQFKYPQDRYLGNSEILTQLLMLEAKFNQQTEILRTLKRKGKYF